MSKGIEPSEKLKKEMYEFYVKVFDSSFDHQKKKNKLDGRWPLMEKHIGLKKKK